MENCLTEIELAALVSGALDGDLREPVEKHLASCGACRMQAGSLLAAVGESGTRPARRTLRLALGAAAAASVLAAAAIGAWRFARPGPVARPGGFQARSVAADEIIRTGAGRTELLALPDGTRLRVGERTVLRFLPPAAGERIRLSLEKGRVEADVAKADGLFRVIAPGGEIRVLGTRFTARAFGLAFPGRPPVPCLHVDLAEGKVSLKNDRGETALRSPMRGVCLAGAAPGRQEARGGWEDVWESFRKKVAADGEIPSLRAGEEESALYAAGSFWGLEEGDAWKRLIRSGSREDRLAAALLVAARRPPGGLEELRTAAREKPDPALAAGLEGLAAMWTREEEER